MENNSSKNLTKGLATVRSSVIGIPKKSFCVGASDSYVTSVDYQVGYYVGTCFHCSQHISNYNDAKNIVESLNKKNSDRKYFIVCIEMYCYRD